MSSLRKALDRKCRGCGGQVGGAMHVSACPVTTYSVWGVRPLASENRPHWPTSLKPYHLSLGFLPLPTKEAIAAIWGTESVFLPVSKGNSETGE